MKRLFLFLFVIVLLLISLLSKNAIFAHEVRFTDTLEVQIHISPNDRPLALQLSRIEINVKDKSRKFDFANCDCLIKIKNGDTTFAELTILGNGTTAEASYTFSAEGERTLVLTGTPKANSPTNFQPFELTYNFSIDPVPITSQATSQQIDPDNPKKQRLYISIILLSVLLAVSIIVYLKKRSQGSEKNKF